MRWALIFSLLWFPSWAHALDVEDGSLLFVENGHNLVECYTNSNFSHVAIVIDGLVYEAEMPEIKTYSIQGWLTKIGRANEGSASPEIVSLVAPDTPYTAEELDRMRTYLQQQVGRRYSIRGYLRGVEGDGIHCSEMCAAAIEVAGRHNFSTANCEISPGDLHDWLPNHHQVGNKMYVYIKKPHRRSVATRWGDWWGDQGRACRWSCFETWTFCW
jgi:hypothetical protein